MKTIKTLQTKITAQGMGKMNQDDTYLMHKYLITINKKRFKFYQGTGVKDAPKVQDVLNSLFLDATAQDETFENWCSNYGYDTDSRRALRVYKACLKNTVKLKEALGSKYNKVKKEIEKLEL